MRRSLRSALATTILSLTLALGCAWKGHIKKGDEFMAAGNYDAAAQEYAQALRARPDDPEIAAKLGQAQVGQIEDRDQRARAALQGNADHHAITYAAEAYAILPDHPTTVALIDHVVDVAGGRAKQTADAGQFAEAMAVYDQMLAQLPSVQARLSAEAQVIAEAWIAQLRTVADEARAAGRLAAALLYESKIAALGGQAQADHAQVIAQLRYLVVVSHKSKDDGARVVAGSLLGRQGASLLELASEGDAAAATLTLALAKPKFSTDKQTRQESAQYQSGTQQVENPFYKMAQDDVLDEERRLVERENEVTKQEQYVDQYSAEVAREGDTPGVTTGMEQNLSNAQSRLEAARRAVEDQRNQVIRAKEKAASTPQTKEEPVYSTHSYTVTTHSLSASTQLTAKLSHADGRAPLTLEQPLSVAAQDDAHPAQDIAGIPENPLQLPSKDELAAQLYAQAAPVVGQLVAESFAGYREQLLTQAKAASEPGEKLDLLMRYVIVDAANAEPQVIADVLALSGVPDAGALILGGM